MSRIDEKLEHFASDIMADVGEERKKILEKIDLEINQAKANKENELLEQSYEMIQKAMLVIDQEKSAAKSKQSMENRRNLFAKRNELIDRVYSRAKIKLAEYRDSDKYYDHMLTLINRGKEALGDGNILVYIDYLDRHLSDKLRDSTGCEIRVESKRIEMFGGCRMQNMDKGTIVDLTFSRRLESIRDDLIIRCRLEID